MDISADFLYLLKNEKKAFHSLNRNDRFFDNVHKTKLENHFLKGNASSVLHDIWFFVESFSFQKTNGLSCINAKLT